MKFIIEYFAKPVKITIFAENKCVMMNYTVIVPHKNVPKLLERLLNSIPFRDDLEIIVVDDNSSDEIVDFNNFPFMGRTNYHVIFTKESHGAGFARNCAIPLAKGKWFLFADSDDFFNESFGDFLSEYVDSDADVIYFNANSVDSDTLEPSSRVDHLHEFIDEYKHNEEHGELILRYLFTEPWCKMVKKELIQANNILFEESRIRNDVRFSYLVGYYAKKIIVDYRQLYCVTTRKNSLSRDFTFEASMDEMKVYAGWKKFFVDHNIPLDVPKFDYRAYNFARHLYKNNKLFRAEYRKMLEAGLSHTYIWGQVIKYLWRSAKYKIG